MVQNLGHFPFTLWTLKKTKMTSRSEQWLCYWQRVAMDFFVSFQIVRHFLVPQMKGGILDNWHIQKHFYQIHVSNIQLIAKIFLRRSQILDKILFIVFLIFQNFTTYTVYNFAKSNKRLRSDRHFYMGSHSMIFHHFFEKFKIHRALQIFSLSFNKIVSNLT